MLCMDPPRKAMRLCPRVCRCRTGSREQLTRSLWMQMHSSDTSGGQIVATGMYFPSLSRAKFRSSRSADQMLPAKRTPSIRQRISSLTSSEEMAWFSMVWKRRMLQWFFSASQ